MKTVFFLFSALFLIASCVDINQKKRLDKIDGMVSTLDSLAEVLKNNELEKAAEMARSIELVEERFKKYYVPDTIDREVHTEINDLKQSRKTLSHLDRDYRNYSLGSQEMKESLRQLRYDIDNGDGDRKNYDEFIAFEEGKLQDLKRLTTDYVEQKEMSLDRYTRLYDKWNAFSLELEKKNK